MELTAEAAAFVDVAHQLASIAAIFRVLNTTDYDTTVTTPAPYHSVYTDRMLFPDAQPTASSKHWQKLLKPQLHKLK